MSFRLLWEKIDIFLIFPDTIIINVDQLSPSLTALSIFTSAVKRKSQRAKKSHHVFLTHFLFHRRHNKRKQGEKKFRQQQEKNCLYTKNNFRHPHAAVRRIVHDSLSLPRLYTHLINLTLVCENLSTFTVAQCCKLSHWRWWKNSENIFKHNGMQWVQVTHNRSNESCDDVKYFDLRHMAMPFNVQLKKKKFFKSI